MMTNPGRMALVHGIGALFMLIGKIFMIFFTLLICYLILNNAEPYKTDVSNVFLPLLIILFIAYAIANIFMLVYGAGIDSIFICFVYDEEQAKAKGTGPKHCPEPLK
mmetsp:Transcript_13177/g.18508  ORF Transcript_13177/g.18508 Transcript_13177/m.18508 type:complete len:107 (-) Transcript_13177:66-386(-)